MATVHSPAVGGGRWRGLRCEAGDGWEEEEGAATSSSCVPTLNTRLSQSWIEGNISFHETFWRIKNTFYTLLIEIAIV